MKVTITHIGSYELESISVHTLQFYSSNYTINHMMVMKVLNMLKVNIQLEYSTKGFQ